VGADTSGNDNHFAVSNLVAVDIVTDTPTNNFCVINPLQDSMSRTGAPEDVVLQKGNLEAYSGATWEIMSTFGFASGKWYYEFKYVNTNNSSGINVKPKITPNGTSGVLTMYRVTLHKDL